VTKPEGRKNSSLPEERTTMKHTDFGEWRVTHDDLIIYHALQPAKLDLADYSGAEKLVDTVARIAAEDWASARTVDDLMQALDFAVEQLSRAPVKSAVKPIDVESIKKALKSQ
jgi:hypothetical protein